MSANKVILGVLGGVAIGAVAGLLFAPDKGTDTRKKLMKKGNDYTRDLKNKFQSMYDSAVDQYDDAIAQTKNVSGSPRK